MGAEPYDVYFTFPSPDLRAELWRRALPKERVDIDDALLRATTERMYRERGKLSTVGPLE